MAIASARKAAGHYEGIRHDPSAAPATESPAIARPSRAWPLRGLAAGVLGVVATVFTTRQSEVGPDRADALAPGGYHLGGALGYLAIRRLSRLAGCRRRRRRRGVAGLPVASGVDLARRGQPATPAGRALPRGLGVGGNDLGVADRPRGKLRLWITSRPVNVTSTSESAPAA